MEDQSAVFEAVARYFSLLGEPTRLRILHSICQEEKCVSDIITHTGDGRELVQHTINLDGCHGCTLQG